MSGTRASESEQPSQYRPRTVTDERHALEQEERGETTRVARKIAREPPLFLPWCGLRSHGDRPFERIHRGYSRLVWRQAKASESRLALIQRILGWPWNLARQVKKATRRHGGTVKELTGKTLPRQTWEQFSLGLRHSIPPMSYYLFRLFEPERRRNAGQYLHRFETKRGLFASLNRNLGDAAAMELLGSKAAFNQRCQQHALPTPPVYLELEGGEVIHRAWQEDSLPPVDLIVKRRRGKGGHVMMRWAYQGEAGYLSAEGETLDAAQLLERMRVEASEIPFLVVKRIKNHADILDLAGADGNILTTCRLLTALNEHGDYEAVSSTFKIAVDQIVADNVHFGGLASAVDLETGTLGPGIPTAPLGVAVDHHPLTGARITGKPLPCWKETVDLSIRAHSGFPEAIFVGWDIGISDDGPVLVEGNSAPRVHLQQTPHGAPLGTGRFAQLMAYHLDRIDPPRTTPVGRDGGAMLGRGGAAKRG